jgi:hypothetical protein
MSCISKPIRDFKSFPNFSIHPRPVAWRAGYLGTSGTVDVDASASVLLPRVFDSKIRSQVPGYVYRQASKNRPDIYRAIGLFCSIPSYYSRRRETDPKKDKRSYIGHIEK